ncbi:MAG: FixH family protein [Crocinitomicaceae bacterium]|nr:FixH family protein [Crocinitomicaceae bacterium]
MNWGKGIIIFMASFMAFILWMVFTLMSKNTDLESEDYYKKEIEYNKEMKALSNANNAKEKVIIKDNKDYFVLQFPADQEIDSINVHLFRPNNEKEDKTFVELGTKTMMIQKSKLQKGIYMMNIQYKIGSETYLQKEEVKI